eukprot:3129527-Prymnesium_polylepis.1
MTMWVETPGERPADNEAVGVPHEAPFLSHHTREPTSETEDYSRAIRSLFSGLASKHGSCSHRHPHRERTAVSQAWPIYSSRPTQDRCALCALSHMQVASEWCGIIHRAYSPNPLGGRVSPS